MLSRCGSYGIDVHALYLHPPRYTINFVNQYLYSTMVHLGTAENHVNHSLPDMMVVLCALGSMVERVCMVMSYTNSVSSTVIIAMVVAPLSISMLPMSPSAW